MHSLRHSFLLVTLLLSAGCSQTLPDQKTPKPLATREVPTGPDRMPHTRPALGQIVEMTLKELGNFPFDPYGDAEVPADVKLLDGAKVRLNGVMVPLDEKIAQFALMEPKFFENHDGPRPHRFVICKTTTDKAVEYSYDNVISVEGTLHIHIQRQDDYTYRIFEMDVTSVTQVPSPASK